MEIVAGKVNAIDAFIQRSKKLILKRQRDRVCLSGYDVPLVWIAGAINEIYDTWC